MKGKKRLGLFYLTQLSILKKQNKIEKTFFFTFHFTFLKLSSSNFLFAPLLMVNWLNLFFIPIFVFTPLWIEPNTFYWDFLHATPTFLHAS